MELQINPDIENLKFWLWIAIGVISVMTVIIGFFVSLQVRSHGKLTDIVSEIKDVVIKLDTIVSTTFPVIDKRLDCHSGQLDSHENRLNKIETEHIHFHKRRKNEMD